ncbi:MAG: hypothetical protein N2Z21_10665 [Candidatus Sumerlaeaceae bacterium]|nr:hypothetical protein [Candidatus Sumerlaeaceae bacterium]
MRITNPHRDQPRITIFDRFDAPAERGYSGIACDAADNVYVSVDAGDQRPSFIRKYLPSLELDTTFGDKGVLASKDVRVVGLTTHKDRILVSISWGRFLVLNPKGEFLGMTPKPEITTYIRDIAYVPSTQRVYGADRDGLYAFVGGTLENLARYKLVEVVEPHFILKSGYAIYYHKATNELFYTDRSAGGITIFPLDGSAQGRIAMTPDGRGALEPADAVGSPDGRYLYVSDLGGGQIVRYRFRGTPAVSKPAESDQTQAGQLWLNDFDEALKRARQGNRLVVVFFHSPLAPRSADVAEKVLTSWYLKKFPEVIWVKIDTSHSPVSLARFGLYKVPTVIVFDAAGKERDRTVGKITQEQITQLIQKHKH